MPRKEAVPFEVKRIIWELAATEQPLNIESVMRRLDIQLDALRQKDEFFGDTPDRRTVRKVISQIDDLVPEVVIRKLPEFV